MGEIETEISGYYQLMKSRELTGHDDCHSPEEWHVFKEMTLSNYLKFSNIWLVKL